MNISKKSMANQMEFLKPVTAARMNSRATKEKNILNSTPKNLYRFAFSGKFIFLSQAKLPLFTCKLKLLYKLSSKNQAFNAPLVLLAPSECSSPADHFPLVKTPTGNIDQSYDRGKRFKKIDKHVNFA